MFPLRTAAEDKKDLGTENSKVHNYEFWRLTHLSWRLFPPNLQVVKFPNKMHSAAENWINFPLLTWRLFMF